MYITPIYILYSNSTRLFPHRNIFFILFIFKIFHILLIHIL